MGMNKEGRNRKIERRRGTERKGIKREREREREG